MRGSKPKSGGANLLFWPNFGNNCMKMKQNLSEERVRVPIPIPPPSPESANAHCCATLEADTVNLSRLRPFNIEQRTIKGVSLK